MPQILKFELTQGLNTLSLPEDYAILSVIEQSSCPMLYIAGTLSFYTIAVKIYVALTGEKLPENIEAFIGTVGSNYVLHIFKVS